VNPAEFDNIARVEDSFWWFSGMHRILLRLLPQYLPQSPRRILEAGAGTGGFAARLRAAYNGPIEVLDLSLSGLRFARKRGLDGLIQADIRRLPLRDGSYDLVLSLDVLVHFRAGEEFSALAEFARVLKPGGLLVLRVSALDILRSRHSQFTHERQRFTRPRLLAAVQGHGLRPLRCTYLNSLLMPIAFFKFRILEPLIRQPAKSGLAPMAPWLNTILEQFLRIESYWLAQGRDFPAGQSLLLFARKA
jgi:SAM-dependent methyltransferase